MKFKTSNPGKLYTYFLKNQMNAGTDPNSKMMANVRFENNDLSSSVKFPPPRSACMPLSRDVIIIIATV